MHKEITNIGIIGAGAWGTALSNILAKKQKVILWAKEKSVCDNINKYQENKRFLPKIKLSKKINCTTEINDVIDCLAYKFDLTWLPSVCIFCFRSEHNKMVFCC